MAALEAQSASSDNPAVQSVIDAAAAVRDVVAGNYGNHLATRQLEEILRRHQIFQASVITAAAKSVTLV
jgi:hypothetical protein